MDEKKKQKVYVSGMITGIPLDEAKAKFNAAKQRLTKRGYEVVTPFDNGLPHSASYAEHMKADLKMLLDCDAIYMLRGWSYSGGAQIEKEVSQVCGLQTIFESDDEEFKRQ